MKKRKSTNKILFTNALKIYTFHKLEEFREYTLEIESKFDSDKNDLAKRLDDFIDGIPEDNIHDVKDFFFDEYYKIDEVFIGVFRKSTVVTIHSFLDHSMHNTCNRLSRAHDYPVKVDDIKGSGIVRSKNYLEKLAKVDFEKTKLNSLWGKIQELNAIRNCIVHTEGNVKAVNSSKKLEKIIERRGDLSLQNEFYIKISRDFVDSCINVVEEFLKLLYDQAFNN